MTNKKMFTNSEVIRKKMLGVLAMNQRESDQDVSICLEKESLDQTNIRKKLRGLTIEQN